MRSSSALSCASSASARCESVSVDADAGFPDASYFRPRPPQSPARAATRRSRHRPPRSPGCCESTGRAPPARRTSGIAPAAGGWTSAPRSLHDRVLSGAEPHAPSVPGQARQPRERRRAQRRRRERRDPEEPRGRLREGSVLHPHDERHVGPHMRAPRARSRDFPDRCSSAPRPPRHAGRRTSASTSSLVASPVSKSMRL